MGSWSLLSLLSGMYPVCYEQPQGCAAQVWSLRCSSGNMAQKWDYGGAYPLLNAVDCDSAAAQQDVVNTS